LDLVGFGRIYLDWRGREVGLNRTDPSLVWRRGWEGKFQAPTSKLQKADDRRQSMIDNKNLRYIRAEF
jgi:hypothetical protein